MKLKYRLIIALVAIISTIIIAKLGTDYLAKPENKTDVVILSKNIKKGERIDQSMFAISPISVDAAHDNTIKSKDEIVGKYALVDLYISDTVNKNHVSNDADTIENYLMSMPEDKKAISISISYLAQSVAAKLQRGDIVSVLGAQDKKEVSSFPELQYVKVIAVINALGNEIGNVSNYTDKDMLPSSIVLEVNAPQAELLYDLERSGSLHFVLAARVDEDKASELLEIQEQYFGGY